MSSESQVVNNSSSKRFGLVLEEIRDEFGKIATYLFSSSNPMTTADKVGLMFTIIALGAILTPIALSNSDPYHLKGILEEVKDSVPLMDNLDKNQDEPRYRIIATLKLSPEFHLDITEKIILGKFNPKSL
jgi:hypothetical protein